MSPNMKSVQKDVSVATIKMLVTQFWTCSSVLPFLSYVSQRPFLFLFVIGIETILNTAGIEVGEGAAILELKNPSKQLQSSYRNKLKECEIKFQAPTGYGIIAYIEQMNMRRHDRDLDCIDYIQFGQDDPVPFYTLKKSQKMCGMKDGKLNSSHGFFYDDPTGKLLVWIGLGGRRKTSHWNEICEVSLSLVITAYKVM